jgi:small subunit ribosomal protein S2
VIASTFSRRCPRALSTDSIPPKPTADLPSTESVHSKPTSSQGIILEDGPITEPLDTLETRTPQVTNPVILAKMVQDAANARIPKDWKAMRKAHRRTKDIGGVVHDARWHPNQLLEDAPADASLELLMASQAHMGHHTSLWNPNNSRYIYGVRSGIHIISLETTLAHLRRAARVVEEVAYGGGLILFVGTRRGHMPIVVRAAELAGACHLFNKWKPGTITNRDQILGAGGLKVVDEMDNELSTFKSHLNDRRPLVPDLVVCFNPIENYTMLHECGLEGVPTIGVIDTNADPSWVTYTIPANDDR